MKLRKLLGIFSLVVLSACGATEPPPDRDLVPAAPPAAPPAPPVQKVWDSGPDHGPLEKLTPPIAPEESRRIRDAFSWKATQPVVETTAEGRPALYYALVYVRNRDEVKALDAYRIHHSFLPLFGEERARWKGQAGVFEHEGDGRGLFAFAVLPGKLYNAIRTYALDGKEAFSAVVLRDVPAPEAKGPGGSIAYGYLAREGFQYLGLPAIRKGAAGGDIGSTRQPIFGWIVRNIIEPIVEVGEDIVDGVRQGLGELDQLLSGEARLNITFLPLTTDPNFGPHSFNVPGGVMRQGWGANRGAPLPLSGVETRAYQGIALHSGDTNDAGRASIVVAADRDTQICVHMQNGAAELTTFLTEVEVCDFGTASDEYDISEDAVNGTKDYTIEVRHNYVNALAQFTDTRRYLHDVGAYGDVGDAVVLVGTLADAFPNAVTPCLDYFNGGFSAAVSAIGGALAGIAGPIVGPLPIAAAEIAEFLYSVDIILPKDSATSRGTPTHEYSHYATCSKLFDLGSLDTAWTDVMLQSLDSDREPSDEASVIAESFADFVSGQVVGGVNYFNVEFEHTHGDGTRECHWGDRSGTPSDGMYYCDPTAPLWAPANPADRRACLEDNIGGPTDPAIPFHQIAQRDCIDRDSFNRAVARMTTLMHDMFDGHPDTSPVRTNVPGNGAAWTFISRPPGPNPDTWIFDGTVTDIRDAGDEHVALPGSGIMEIFDEWESQSGNYLTLVSFERGLSQVMTNHGYTDDQICELFRRHDRNSMCPTYLPVALNATPARPVVTGLVLPDRRGQWTWNDFSAAATSYRYSVTNVTTGATLYSGSLPYSRQASYTTPFALPYNSEIRFEVRTINGLRQGDPSNHRLFTPAERVATIASASALPERVQLGWTGTRAARYVIEKQAVGTTGWTVAAELDDGAAASESFTVFGLAGGTAYDFRIVALNLVGEPALPSSTRRVTPIQPETLHVSAATGDDAHADAGTAAHPYKTLRAAFVRVAAEQFAGNARFNAVLLKLASGSYSYDQPFVLGGGRYLRIAGTFVQPAWTAGGAVTSVSLTGFTKRTPSCSSSAFSGYAGGILDTYASLVAENGATLALTDVTVDAAVSGQGRGFEAFVDCYTPIHAEDSGLWLDGATVRTSGDPVDGACRLGAQVVDRTHTAQVQIEDSTLLGLDTSATSITYLVQLGGLCVDGAEFVTIDRSTLAGVTGPQLSAPGTQIIAMGGLTERVGSVRMGRSRAVSVRDKLDWHIASGFQTSLLLGSESVLVHDSTLRTAHGGNRNTGLMLVGEGRGRAHLYGNTIAAGADFLLENPVSAGMRGAVMVYNGTYDSLHLVNNLLVYAAGADSGTQITGIDRRGQGTDPRSMLMRGNAFSIPQKGNRTLSICRDEEFGSYGEEQFLNIAWTNSCLSAAARYDNDVGGNWELDDAPLDVDADRPTVVLMPDGRVAPLNLISLLILAYGAHPLTGNPLLSTVQTDLGGAIRPAGAPSIGAYVIGFGP